MREEITSNFNGVDIAYNIHDNKWFYTSEAGRRIERNSLKECIFCITNAPAPKEKKKPFTPFKAFKWSQYGHGSPHEVTVTSYAGADERCVWIKEKDGSRSKESLRDMVTDSPQTHAIIAEHARLSVESEKIEKAQRDLRNGCPGLPPAPKE